MHSSESFATVSEFFFQLRAHVQKASEATLLGIGGRGYYENPTSDLLQFFLVPTNAHGLGTLFLESLLEALNETLIEPEQLRLSKSSANSISVRREVAFRGKRLDILIEAPDWVIAIENKIWHHQFNPFETYEDLVLTRTPKNAKHQLIVLSPTGKCHQDRWKGISYKSILHLIQDRLTSCTPRIKANKWWHFAQDFIEHLRQEIYPNPMTEDQIEFIETHQNELEQAIDLQIRYKQFIESEIVYTINAVSPTPEVYTKSDSWCIRIHHPNWGNSNIAWSRESENNFNINLTIYLECNDPQQMSQAEELFTEKFGLEYWQESRGRWHCWRTRPNKSNVRFNTTEHLLINLAKSLFDVVA